MIALLLTAVLWHTHPTPSIWICNPGKAPPLLSGILAPPGQTTSCERLPFIKLGVFRLP